MQSPSSRSPTSRHPLRERFLIRVRAAYLVIVFGAACAGTYVRAASAEGQSYAFTPPVAPRDRLTVEQLLGGSHNELVHNGYFEPVGEPRPARHSLCGTLRFAETRMETRHPDTFWMGGELSSGGTVFPELAIPVVTNQGWLIPLYRGLILSGDGAGAPRGSYWNAIANPGHVWDEPTDAGYSRAAFPLTLTDNYIGQARNALVSFVFDDLGASPAAVQITQETAPADEYQRVDFQALVPVAYEPGCAEDVAERVAAFERELAGRLPLRPWSDLPDASSSQALSRRRVGGTDLSALALLMDGRLYAQPVSTRSGPHPWPEWMRHGVFSVTKTIGLGLSMFHLAERYGDAIFDERITDHLPELADHPGWCGVTFQHVLGMVTGTAGSDEGWDIAPFIRARGEAAKLAAIHQLPDAEPAPGTRFRYASTHFFVLSAALNRYVKAQEGAEADYWRMVEQDVLEPIGVPHLPISRSIEADGSLGTPVMGWGSYPDVDAVAKIAQLLQDEGVHEGRALLSRTMVREALRRGGVSDYPTANPIERYLHSVWTVRIDTGRCSVAIPLMSGHGGNHVMIMPSGLSVVRFTDACDYEVAETALAAESYRSSCPASRSAR